MRKELVWTILAAILMVAIGAGIFCWNGSFENVLRQGNFTQYAEVFDCGWDTSGDEYRAVMEYNQEEAPSLALLKRTSLGTWEMTDVDYPSETDLHPTIGWMRMAGIARFAVDGETGFITEYHKVYSGNDAVKLIEIPEGMLPYNIAVEIRQAGSAYMLHLVTYSSSTEEMEQWNKLDVIQKLQQAGYIRG